MSPGASDPNAKYTAAELARLTGVTERTVRYYVREALIDAPFGRGRGPHFGDRHLNQLRRVRYLQSTGLDLDTIRARFEEIHRHMVEKESAKIDPRIIESWPPEMIALDQKQNPFFPWGKGRPENVHTSAVTVLEVAPGISLHVAAPNRLPGPAQLAMLTGAIRFFFNTGPEEEDDGEDDSDED